MFVVLGGAFCKVSVGIIHVNSTDQIKQNHYDTVC